MSDESDDGDPFTCPMCSGSVRVSGGGVKDCTECSWEFRPSRDTSTETTRQAGLKDY